MAGNKKQLTTIIIVLAVIAVGVIGLIVYFATGGDKTPEEEYYEEKAEIMEEITNQTGKELENKEASIAQIQSVASQVMAGSNIRGKTYLFKNESDRRITEREEYFSIVGFWADEHEVTTDYAAKMLRDLDAIKLKCAELFKALYQTENKVYLARCEAYQSDDELRPVYSVTLERESAEQVDWNKDAASLLSDELSGTWSVGIDNFWLYE